MNHRLRFIVILPLAIIIGPSYRCYEWWHIKVSQTILIKLREACEWMYQFVGPKPIDKETVEKLIKKDSL